MEGNRKELKGAEQRGKEWIKEEKSMYIGEMRKWIRMEMCFKSHPKD